MPTTLLQSDLPGLELLHRGKVRDVYALPKERLLIVATDRLSAFDVVLPDPIPGKGEMLTQISNFWFGKTAHLLSNHLTGMAVEEVLPQGVDARIDWDAWERPPVFQWLVDRGVREEELRSVFNLGIGMCAVVPEAPPAALVIGELA